MKVIQEIFDQIENQTVQSFTMVNNHGIEITSINYGCIITKIVAPDKHGKYENIVLGYDSIDEYVKNNSYFGSVCGRVAGRIKAGSFELDGQEYSLAKNDRGNHLHGGINGFDKVVWDADIIENEQEVGVQFSYLSPDGKEGYPGNLTIKVNYTLNNNNELLIQYTGQTDQKTLLNVTNHSYFNLSGNLKRDILNHSLKIKSDKFLELNNELLPTGSLLDVENTPFDFNHERLINTGVTSDYPQNLLAGNGYDHPFLLNTNRDNEIVLKDPESGRTLTIETDEAGVVVYTGNSLSPKGEIRGVPSRKYLGICLETQGLPDAIHHSHFPSWILNKDAAYASGTKYRFGIEEKDQC
ncbi:aldose epimerase family protein [Neobacillus ginsengisoli]|uniref:Aldose 1-epimerase n=1 Tax=Neobacillus ginsengisoli TaxID=904295 RepID=A0ABT9XT70_9BACI|nr:aldose epimerase family protein [Neobacillus ginsengisoli]MDQ0198757.1 aldose 1-epimerase [Neobacillus ginsengisoli]